MRFLWETKIVTVVLVKLSSHKRSKAGNRWADPYCVEALEVVSIFRSFVRYPTTASFIMVMHVLRSLSISMAYLSVDSLGNRELKTLHVRKRKGKNWEIVHKKILLLWTIETGERICQMGGCRQWGDLIFLKKLVISDLAHCCWKKRFCPVLLSRGCV